MKLKQCIENLKVSQLIIKSEKKLSKLAALKHFGHRILLHP
jgi:hypothetical protein